MTSYRINNLLDPSSTQDAATKSYVDTSIPVGGIIMWSGTTGTSLPSNWKLCDGSTYNSIKTPDLRGRFVLSSGSGSGLTGRTVDNTGGAETVTLTVAQMPIHGHGVSARTGDANYNANDGGHTHSISDPGHSHESKGGTNMNYLAGWPLMMSDNTPNRATTETKTTGITITSDNMAYNGGSRGTYHNHTITVTQSNAGSGDPHSIMPPFYVLAFIMRVS